MSQACPSGRGFDSRHLQRRKGKIDPIKKGFIRKSYRKIGAISCTLARKGEIRRRFSLYERNGIFYVRFWNPTRGDYTSGISTGKMKRSWHEPAGRTPGHSSVKNRIVQPRQNRSLALTAYSINLKTIHLNSTETEKIIAVLRERNLIDSALLHREGPASERLTSSLHRFWDYDQSPYIAEKKAYGHSIGRKHCHSILRRVKHWETYFADKTVNEITRDQLQDFLNLFVRNAKEPYPIDQYHYACKARHVTPITRKQKKLYNQLSINPQARTMTDAEQVACDFD